MRPGRQVKDRLIIADVPAYLQTITGVRREKWTIHRWTVVGKLSYTNRVVKLRFEKILRQKYTRKRWVQEFIRELEQ